LFIIFAVFAYLCWQGFANVQETARARAQTAADVLSQEVKWVAGASLATLQLLEEKLALMPAALDPTDKADLDAAIRLLPVGARLAIYDAQGLAVPNGGSPSLPADISQTDYFTALRDGAERMILPLTQDLANGNSL